jgi:hypothetical protein
MERFVKKIKKKSFWNDLQKRLSLCGTVSDFVKYNKMRFPKKTFLNRISRQNCFCFNPNFFPAKFCCIELKQLPKMEQSD